MSHLLFSLSLFLLQSLKTVPVSEIIFKLGIDRQCLKAPPSKGDDQWVSCLQNPFIPTMLLNTHLQDNYNGVSSVLITSRNFNIKLANKPIYLHKTNVLFTCQKSTKDQRVCRIKVGYKFTRYILNLNPHIHPWSEAFQLNPHTVIQTFKFTLVQLKTVG